MNNETCGEVPCQLPTLPPSSSPQYSSFSTLPTVPAADRQLLTPPHSAFPPPLPPMRLEKNLLELFEFLSTPERSPWWHIPVPTVMPSGSCLALKFFLEKEVITAEVIAPDDFPDFLNWMKGSDKVFIRQKNPKTCFAILANSDLIGFLDFNALKE